jgi:AraC family transcriptional regulator
MTLAAFDLHMNQLKVIDVAAKYGYESQSSFTRAFRHQHGITPSAACKETLFFKCIQRYNLIFLYKEQMQLNC